MNHDKSSELLFLHRLKVQGPAHPQTRTTLWNLVVGKPGRSPGVPGTPADLPEGVTPEGVRLDGEHVEAEIDLQQLAMALQQNRVDTFGSDDPRTMMSTCYLAYALALGDHIDGQLTWAAALADDAYEGLADADDEGAAYVGPHDVEIANIIRGWITQELDQADG
jgi:hypothetical protein